MTLPRIIIQLMLLVVVLATFSVPVWATERNIYGIHLAVPQTEDIKKASELVNGTQGSWGYITLVIQENDRDVSKWQDVFDQLREHQLIPIIRLATQPEGEFWRRPAKEDASAWVAFLNKLNWVVKDRYITLFNEPNHGSEWGGETDAENYAEVAVHFAKAFSEYPEYVVMPAGFDASAPKQVPNYDDEVAFIDALIKEAGVQEFSKLFHAWSSHSYPNPAFSGSVNDSGRGTVRTYQWELAYLQKNGINSLPAYITETGWDAQAIGIEQAGKRIHQAFQTVWLPDDRVHAVTPFILNYQGEPFAKFSWLSQGSAQPTSVFETVRILKKQQGTPEIMDSAEMAVGEARELVVDSRYRIHVRLKNMGQGIWDVKRGYQLALEGVTDNSGVTITNPSLKNIRPKNETVVDILLHTSAQEATISGQVVLKRGTEIIARKPWNARIVGVPSIAIEASTLWWWQRDSNDYELQVFDADEELVYKRDNISLTDGKSLSEPLKNVVLNNVYRVVLIKPGYLPRQTFTKIKGSGSNATFEVLLPFDTNRDGALSWRDLTFWENG